MSKVHFYEDSHKEFRWRLVDNNGRIISDSSEGYVSEDNALEGFENAKKEMAEAEIVKAADA